MGLKDLKLPTSTVETPGGSFSVRGVSTVEIEQLFREHRLTFSAMFDQFKSAAEAGEDIMGIAGALLQAAPELVARVICMAGDEPDDEALAAVMKWTPALQIRSLTAIAAVTFTVEGSLGKMTGSADEKITTVTELLELVTNLLELVPTAKA